jgi:beta-fructofuranosidase
VEAWAEHANTQRAALAHDPHRPVYHFLPPSNWTNDPNGFIHFGGQYHLFYQYNPGGAYWANMHWGHAVSDDLVHWTDWPIALTPTHNSPDEAGCFSGCAVNNNGVPTLIYTGVRGEGHVHQTQCIATSRDGLLTWEKFTGNPVLAVPPPDVRQADFRDPFVWREGDEWRMVVSTGVEGVGGAVLLYRSSTLTDWTYISHLYTGDMTRDGTIWECPNFLSLGDRHLLFVSVIPLRAVYSYVGAFDGERFVPDTMGRLDWGSCYYAPLATCDANGRWLVIGWVWEERPEAEYRAAGWAGLHALPRVLSLSPEGALLQQPAPELTRLRGEHTHVEAARFEAGEHLVAVRGDALEIGATFSPEAATNFGLLVRRATDGSEVTRILYDMDAGELVVDRTHASLDTQTVRDVIRAPLPIVRGATRQMRVFIDKSVVEIFADGQLCLTTRIYPTRGDSDGVALYTDGALVGSLDIWHMGSIWSVS